ncbi:MAG: trypsin-like peptidase domain-containing protein [Ruthenibacterium sp.]
MNNNQWDYDYSGLYHNARQSRADGHSAAQTEYAATGAEQSAYPHSAPAAKKKGTGKRVAALALAVVLCAGAGVGGGYFGGTLAAKNSAPGTVINQVPAGGSGVGAVATAGSGISVTQVANIAVPSVVEVTTEQVTTNPFFGQYVTDGAGSGVIISADGYIATNSHVVSGAQQIKVTLSDKKEYIAKLVGTDPKTDIAVLKIDGSNLPAATIGDSAALTVGDFALAVGNPLGTLGGTVTDGIISALDREITVGSQTMTLLQTNAAVSPGNSGGGLFNSKGELIGIVNAKSSGDNAEGLGFAIPVNTAIKVARELMDNGYVTGRPALGINVLAINDAQTAAQYNVTRPGVYVMTVNKGSAAEKAGLQAGDLIMSANGEAVTVSANITKVLDACAVGDTVEMQIIREDKVLTISVKLQERSADADRAANSAVQDYQEQFGND